MSREKKFKKPWIFAPVLRLAISPRHFLYCADALYHEASRQGGYASSLKFLLCLFCYLLCYYILPFKLSSLFWTHLTPSKMIVCVALLIYLCRIGPGSAAPVALRNTTALFSEKASPAWQPNPPGRCYTAVSSLWFSVSGAQSTLMFLHHTSPGWSGWGEKLNGFW